MGRDPLRLTVWNTGVVSVASVGEDGSSARVEQFPDGVVTTLETDAIGSRRLSVRRGTDIDRVRLIDGPRFLAAEEADAFGGPWTEVTKTITLDDGRKGTVTVSTDASGHAWERGRVPQSLDADGWGIPGRDWTRITHPPNDSLHPSSGARGETVELGRERIVGKSGKSIESSYTIVGRHERDSMGRDTTVHVGSSYSSATGEQQHWASARASDGTSSWTNVTRQTDGGWTIKTTTLDKDGHGTVHETKGKGDQVTSDETRSAKPEDKPKGEGSGSASSGGSGEEDPDKDKGGEGTAAPTGDGEGGTEGNPDAGVPFDSVRLADLLPDGWSDGEIDTLGDLDAALRPWIDRMLATARHGGVSHEELDSLGAPPMIGFDLSGYEEDELADHDSLGRPRPIFTSLVEVDSTAGAGLGAAALIEMEQVAHGFTVAASTLTGVQTAISAAGGSSG